MQVQLLNGSREHFHREKSWSTSRSPLIAYKHCARGNPNIVQSRELLT
jgi:hypothetical protein